MRGLKAIVIVGMVVGMAAAASFVWGIMVHRNHVFPFALVEATAAKLSIVKPTRTTEIEPAGAPLQLLKSLPYVQATFDPDSQLRGVIRVDSSRAQPGINFYSVSGQNRAELMDMAGKTIHQWTYRPPKRFWDHAELLSDGSVLVVVNDYAVLKLNRCSELLWSYETRAHHGLSVDGEGNIYLITREPVAAPEIHAARKILDDRIVVLTADGAKLDEISLLELFRGSPYEYLLPSVNDRAFPAGAELDPLHANHVEVFDGRLSDLSPLFERGNFLISLRHLNAIAIVDGGKKEIIWLWGPNNVALQHHPRLLPNGHILLFDNGTERSRVIELDPILLEVVWAYEGGTDFFSSWGGAVQRLPNGNTLITESERGYATEVTPAGEIAWRFANPDVDDEGKRLNIWRMTRLPPSDLSFLAESSCRERTG